MRFSEQLNSGNSKRNLLQTAKNWEDTFSLAHSHYLSEEYLSNIFSDATKSK